MEGMLSLLTGLDKYRRDFVNKIDFANQHSDYKRTDECQTLKVHVIFDCLQGEMTAQYFEVVQRFRCAVVCDVAAISQYLYGLL